ncbi:MAG: hypothetical protein ABUK01_04150 [Leptospirales bacterium]
MKKTLWIFLPLLALSVGACKTKKCKPAKLEYSIGDAIRVTDFAYKNGKLISSHISMKDGSKDFGYSHYAYREYGKLDKVSNTYLGTMKFEHNNTYQLTSIETKLGTIQFELDKKGRIVTESSPMGKRTYEYENDLPVKATIYDYNGNLYSVNEYVYDDKPNFMIQVYAGNPLQLLHGFAVAHAKNNVIKIVETYQQNLKYEVNGKKWKKGEVDTQEIVYQYSEDGYPISQKLNDSDTMRVEYVCGE